MGRLYYQLASKGSVLSSSDKINADYNLTYDIGMLRLLRTLQISEAATLAPQVLFTFGLISGDGDVSSLSSDSGSGDLILTVPLKVKPNDGGDIFSFAPYCYVPSGSYDHNDALNLGENRWKVNLQAAG